MTSLTTSFLNVCSLRRKSREVQEYLSTRGIHLLGVAETWLDSSIADGEVTIPHYQLHRKDRSGQQGGGVAFYCHDSVIARRRPDLEMPDLEVLWLEVGSHKATNTLIGCCYRPPDRPSAYWDAFEHHLDRVFQGQHAATILIGDFNVDFGKRTSPGYLQFNEVLTKFNLSNHVTSPTRVTSRSATTLDLFLATIPIDGVCETVFLDISDHCAVLASVKVSGKDSIRSSVQRRTRRLHRVNWDDFNADLAAKQDTIDFNENLDNIVSSFTSVIMSTLDSHAPLQARRRRDRRPCPWLTAELVSAVRDRNRLHRLWVRDKSNADLRNQHRAARSTARKLDRKLRNAYFTAQCRTSDQRKLWSVMNTVVGRRKHSTVPQASLSDLSTFFGSVVHDPQRPASLSIPSGPLRETCLAEFDPVCIDDVTKCLKAVDSHKATGSDMVPGLVLKECARTLGPPLTRIINSSLQSGKFPTPFKVSHISPLFKSGDPASARNYRPVSLLPIISRIVEAVVKKQLTAYLIDNDLFPETQFAYRKQHSTEDALTLAVSRWQAARADRKFSGVVFVDMSKAFDRVQHERLIAELFSLGISGKALLWFCSYLSSRVQHVRVQDCLSDGVSCSRGVPQGSVLGPLLFVIYTKEIKSVIPREVSHQEFADDIVLDCANSNSSDVCTALSTGINNLADWLEDAGLLLNAQKTQVLFIKPRGAADVQEQVECRGVPLEATESARYLGVIIDSDLSWKHHVDHLARKTAQTVGQLWRHGRSLSLRARRTWYVSMVLSQLSYGSNCFTSSLTVQLLDRIHKMSKSGIRATLQQREFLPTGPMLDMLGISSLPQLLLQKLLVLVYRCLHSLASNLLQQLFSRTAPDQPDEANRVTRGHVTSLLRVPFMRGPAGRRSVQFFCSTLWNALPVAVRTVEDVDTFKLLIRSLELSAAH